MVVGVAKLLVSVALPASAPGREEGRTLASIDDFEAERDAVLDERDEVDGVDNGRVEVRGGDGGGEVIVAGGGMIVTVDEDVTVEVRVATTVGGGVVGGGS
jgi:hypothetical protein